MRCSRWHSRSAKRERRRPGVPHDVNTDVTALNTRAKSDMIRLIGVKRDHRRIVRSGRMLPQAGFARDVTQCSSDFLSIDATRVRHSVIASVEMLTR